MMHHEHMCAVNGPEGDGVPREETRGLRPQRGPRDLHHASVLIVVGR